MNEQVALAQEKYPRAYNPWTPESDLLLLSASEMGLSVDRMAEIFKRGPGAIRSRLRRLGVHEAPNAAHYKLLRERVAENYC